PAPSAIYTLSLHDALPICRDEIPKAEALRIFSERDEPLKCELIDEKAGDVVSVYYIDGSPFIDFCLGPHVPNTNRLRAFKLLSLDRKSTRLNSSHDQISYA